MANSVSFEQLMNGFGVVTVMNACIYELADGRYVGAGGCQHSIGGKKVFYPSDWKCTGEYLDTLKIANLTQEGPTKTITGGQYANPIIKYGKTMTAEMQDALGKASTLVRFFGCEYVNGKTYKQNTKYKFTLVGDGTTKDFIVAQDAANATVATKANWTVEDVDTSTLTISTTTLDSNTNGVKVTLSVAPAEGDMITLVYTPTADVVVNTGDGRVSVTDKFAPAFAIEGDTFFIDQKTGEKVDVHIFIPQFIPDSIFNLTQDAEGDASVFDLNGTVAVTTVADAAGEDSRDIFYEIRSSRFFEGAQRTADHV